MKTNFLLLLLAFCLGTFSLHAQDAADDSFYSLDKIQSVKIDLPYPNWAYLLDSLRFNGDGLLLGNVSINGTSFENVGVRYSETNVFQPGEKRNNLYIQLDYIDQSQKIEGHTQVHLSNALRDPSMVREVLSFAIARTYMPAPQANYANVSINDELVGLYVNVEPIGKAFLERNFGSSDGACFKARSFRKNDQFPDNCKQKLYGSLEYDSGVECFLANYEMESNSGWDELIELTRILNQQPEKIETMLDVDQTLWMLAFNNALVNLSSYSGQHSQNFYLYRDQSGRFHPIMYDLNLSFGSYKSINSSSDLRFKQLAELDPLLHIDNPTKPLISKLLANPLYKKIYLSHLRTITYDYFSSGKYEEMAKDYQRSIQRDFAGDPNKFYTYEEFNNSLYNTIGKKSNIPGIVELMEKRADFLKKHPDLAVLPPKITDVTVLAREQFSSVPIETFRIKASINRFPKRVKLMYRFEGDPLFKEAVMMDDGEHNDAEANDGIYGVTIVPQGTESKLEYYIMAENPSAIGYFPENYMWERRTITLEELN